MHDARGVREDCIDAGSTLLDNKTNTRLQEMGMLMFLRRPYATKLNWRVFDHLGYGTCLRERACQTTESQTAGDRISIVDYTALTTERIVEGVTAATKALVVIELRLFGR